MKPKSQQEKVENHLLKGKTLTPLQALRLYGSMRLGAIIFKLRKSYRISTTYIKVKPRTWVARYKLGK
jgi:hypothetical protein